MSTEDFLKDQGLKQVGPCHFCIDPETGKCIYPKTNQLPTCPVCGCSKEACPTKEKCNGQD